MVSAVKAYMLKLAPKLKTSKSLNLLLVDLKPNNSRLMRLEIAGVAQNKQECCQERARTFITINVREHSRTSTAFELE